MNSAIARGGFLGRRARLTALAVAVGAGSGLFTWAGLTKPNPGGDKPGIAPPPNSSAFYPTAAQWATLTVEPVKQSVFRPVYVTEGKIAVNEDLATPVYSPYAGRVIRLLAKPGDRVARGQPLLILEATDAVQVHNDFITAITALNKANAQLKLAQTVERRLSALYEVRAIALKDWQQAQADLISAQNDASAAEAALEAARNRLRISGAATRRSPSSRSAGRSPPRHPSSHPSTARSCNARSAPDNTSPAAAPIPSS